MTGRIKRKQLQAKLEALPAQHNQDVVCPLCERPIPAAQQDAHHLVPKSLGGKQTVVLHRMCHRQIHALFKEAELAHQLNSIETLKQHKELARFIQWVRGKPNDFLERTRKSQRLKICS